MTLRCPSGRPSVLGVQPPCVLHVSRPAVGGLRRHLETLLPRLSKCGWMVFLAAPAGLVGNGDAPLAGHPVLPVQIQDQPSPVADLRAAVQLRRAIKRAEPSLVHCHGIRAAWVSWLAGHGKPQVVTVHNLFTLPRGIMQAYLARAALRSAVVIVAVSEAVRSSLVTADIPPERVCVIPNGIDPPEPVSPADLSAFRKRLGPENFVPLVACVARLMPDKGVDILLEAWRIAGSRIPGGALVIAGDGPDRPALEAVASGLSGVRFLGFLPDVRPLYAAADILVIPSRREGQSIVCLEAMMSQPPPALLVTAAGGLPEMVHNGETGLVVPPEDPSALAEALVLLADDDGLRACLATAAAATARNRYTAAGMADATLEVYCRIIPGAACDGRKGNSKP
ncbi:MAG: glycosyl transferase family 1 [Armatimonadota bacterium]|nr:MAG: glycosyl transferase family 1 [Armatimonadota bacterium]